MPGTDNTSDYIVVGAGSAGCVLADRLTADGRHKVLLLEAGPEDRSPWIHIPIGYGKTMFHPVYNWGFYTEPEPEMQHLAAEELMEMVRSLPDKYRLVFNLFGIEGYSHKEIAEMLQINEGTSKSQLSKARALLQKWVTAQENFTTEKNGTAQYRFAL